MFNILTIDLEDYFQVHAFSRVIRYEDWDKFECRIERNTDRLLTILRGSAIKNGSTVAPQHSSTAAPENNSKLNIQNSKLIDSVPSPQHLKPQHRSTSSPKNDSAINTQQSTINNPIRATFFVLGWIAERYPGLVRRIQEEGHEIACHGYAHRLVYTQSRDEFRQDVKRAKSILEDITGNEVIGYRAPSYSITNKSQWAFEVLVEEGFKYDSSIFPIRHDFYGMPEAPRFPFIISLSGNNNVEFSMLNVELKTTQNSKLNTQHSELNAQSSVLEVSGVPEPQHGSTAALNNSLTHSLINPKTLIEFPISTVKLFGQNFPISGGGYFRLFPYSLIRKGLRSINQKESKPFIFYVHPWEFDTDQPRIKGAANLSKFRHYVNLGRTESRFKKLLSDFQFSTVRQLLIQTSKLKTQN